MMGFTAAATALAGAASVAGSAISANASQSAAQTQANAANSATQLEASQFNKTQANLSPYMSLGQNAASSLENLTGTNPGGNPLTAALTAQFQPTMAQLAATPGFQFTLGQGLQATQNSYAAQGLGQSGAALKGAANYSEGLAGTTYQQQFQNYLTQNSQIYNMLGGQVSTGENAAAGVGNVGAATANAESALMTGGAAATAAGQVGVANALSNGLGGASNSGLLYSLAGNGGSNGLIPGGYGVNQGQQVYSSPIGPVE